MAKQPPNECPKCGKTNTIKPMGEREGGFSGKKAVIGGFLLGPVGIAAGALGKKKVMYQCTNCDYTIEL